MPSHPSTAACFAVLPSAKCSIASPSSVRVTSITLLPNLAISFGINFTNSARKCARCTPPLGPSRLGIFSTSSPMTTSFFLVSPTLTVNHTGGSVSSLPLIHCSNAAAMRVSINAIVRTMTGWKPTPAPISPKAEADSYNVTENCGQCLSRAMVRRTPAIPPPTTAREGAS